MNFMDVCPPAFHLKKFVKCLNLINTFFILDQFKHDQTYKFSSDTVLDSVYLKIWSISDGGKLVGNAIQHRGMESIKITDHYIQYIRYRDDMDIRTVSDWKSDFIRVIEGENGCLVMNLCSRWNIIEKRIDAI